MAGLDPAAMTLTRGSQPFSLTPVIKDLLRTRFCIPGSVFLVEGVDSAAVTRSGRWRALRLLLGDGEVCIQALLDGAMHRFVETGEIGVGCYVRVQRFELRSVGEAERMVFLVLRDLATVGWNETVTALRSESESPGAAEESVDSAEEKGTEDKGSQKGLELHHQPLPEKQTLPDKPRDEKPQGGQRPLSPPSPIPRRTVSPNAPSDADLGDAFEAFETLAFPLQKPASQQASAHPSLPVALARDWHDPQTPLKLTTLRSIPHLPYAQNWSCNVLAIITALSPIEPSHLPPFRQRIARIADPSTAKRVHLTVFLDPDAFVPRVGSAVLLTGVKNHRFDGGSLKKYASDGPAPRWWLEDPWHLAWCDVAGIKRWWAEVETAFAA